MQQGIVWEDESLTTFENKFGYIKYILISLYHCNTFNNFKPATL